MGRGTMQEYIISGAGLATPLANQSWTIRMQKESHTVSKNGVEWNWKDRTTLGCKARLRIRKSSVKDARMAIVEAR
jgi:hypothetical protein